MRDIYLIDFENVASEGLSGITYLSPEDEVIIFYSNNSNRLSMKMHILIGKSVCKCNYFEVTVGGKNALDHQISTWLGYLIGTRAADRNYYIVSKDMGYKFVASFWTESAMHPSVRCIDNIRAAGRIGRSRAVKETEPEETALPAPEQTPAEIPAGRGAGSRGACCVRAGFRRAGCAGAAAGKTGAPGADAYGGTSGTEGSGQTDVLRRGAAGLAGTFQSGGTRPGRGARGRTGSGGSSRPGGRARPGGGIRSRGGTRPRGGIRGRMAAAGG